MKIKEIARRSKDFTHNIYDHGASRIFIDGESGDRQLLVDTYYDKEFAEFIEKCTRQYFGLSTTNNSDLAEQILIKNINEFDLHFIFYDKKHLWQDLIDALNEALSKTELHKTPVRLSFDELTEKILKYNAKSEYQQASIIILRNIFKETEMEREK